MYNELPRPLKSPDAHQANNRGRIDAGGHLTARVAARETARVDLAGINQDALDALCREHLANLALDHPEAVRLISERLRRAENTITAYRQIAHDLHHRNNLGNAEAAE
jgi:hypothetical protein